MFTILISVMKKMMKDSEVHIEGNFKNNLKGFNDLQKQRDQEFKQSMIRSSKDRDRIEYCIELIEKLNK